MFIQYTPLREVIGGAGEIETGSFPLNRARKVYAEQSVSLSRQARETVGYGDEKTWDITTIPEELTTEPRWREFEASVQFGETFTIDLFGTQAAPVDPITVSMELKSFKESRPFPRQKVYKFAVVER
jgi:hypothetical protein